MKLEHICLAQFANHLRRKRAKKTTADDVTPMMNNVGRLNSPPIPLDGSVEEDDVAVGLGEGWVVGPGVGVFPGVELGVLEGIGVNVLVGPGVDVEVGVEVSVGTSVPVLVDVGVEVSVGTGVSVLVEVGVGVSVAAGGVLVSVGVKVFVGVGVSVGASCAMLTLRLSQRRLAPLGGGDSIWKQAKVSPAGTVIEF